MSDLWRADFAASPPFHHVADLAARLASRDWPRLDRLDAIARERGLSNAAGLPVSFAAQHVRCGQRDYEAGILGSGRVPSRERNWHDLLNALTWLAFPRAKAALNAVQCSALPPRPGNPRDGQRGARSDAATLFDESGLLLVAEADAMAGLLAARRWQEAFIQRRAAWTAVRAYAFGHALLQKLMGPWPGITAKCLFLRADRLPDLGLPPAWLDTALAEVCRNDSGDGRMHRPADLFPVPLLGIPGWWPGNGDPAFYLDASVFRPLRIG